MYQKGFYTRSRELQDRANRQEQAEKIAYVFDTYFTRPLSKCIALDLGCANGAITSLLALRFNVMIGLEYDEIAIRNTLLENRQATGYAQGDGLMLPFPNAAFDVIICAQVYEHVADDRVLFEEIERVLKPGGQVFFSGPNLLFPIEPHYLLPFLHWLPKRIANLYLRVLRKGDQYYERSRTIWGLRKIMEAFTILDVTIPILRWKSRKTNSSLLELLMKIIPEKFWRLLLPLFPNYNWVLQKPTK